MTGYCAEIGRDMRFSPVKGLITYACARYTDVLSCMQEYVNVVGGPDEMPEMRLYRED
jgi:hypothetical protein